MCHIRDIIACQQNWLLNKELWGLSRHTPLLHAVSYLCHLWNTAVHLCLSDVTFIYLIIPTVFLFFLFRMKELRDPDFIRSCCLSFSGLYCLINPWTEKQVREGIIIRRGLICENNCLGQLISHFMSGADQVLSDATKSVFGRSLLSKRGLLIGADFVMFTLTHFLKKSCHSLKLLEYTELVSESMLGKLFFKWLERVKKRLQVNEA